MARTRGLNDAVHELEALRPYPDPANLRKASAAQEWQAELLGPPADRPRFLNIPRLLSTLLTAPEYSLHDVYGLTRGQIFSLELLVPEVSKLNLTTLGSDFRVPAFFFHGRFDPYTRPALIEAYARTVTAPHHELVWFERAGHFPFYRNSSCSPTNCSGACARLSTPSDHGSSKIGSDRRPSGGAAGGRSPLSLDLCFGSLPSAARRPRCPVAPCGWDIRTIEHIETVDRSTPRTPQIEALLQGREAGESDTRPLAQALPSPHSPYAMRSTPRVTIRA